MTVQEIREAAKVMEAYANGKKIQCNDNHLGNGEWVTTDNPSFNWDKYAYRIKPESKYRHFKNQEECWNEMLKHQPFGWVIDKADNKYFDISMIYHFTEIKSETKVITVGKVHTLKEAFNNLTFADGTPFGIREKQQ